jgi:membrane protein
VIYHAVPNGPISWRAVWPGAASATVAIALLALAFPLYLANVSTIAQFGTTVVFVLIVLAWFYILAIIILGGGVLNSMRVPSAEAAVDVPVEPVAEAATGTETSATRPEDVGETAPIKT